MTIETKFNIGDLVQHKYQRVGVEPKKQVSALSVIEISCVNCYTTAQVFYTCRALHAVFDISFKEGKTIKEVVDISFGRTGDHEYLKLREDELKPCDPELVNEIKKGINETT